MLLQLKTYIFSYDNISNVVFFSLTTLAHGLPLDFTTRGAELKFDRYQWIERVTLCTSVPNFTLWVSCVWHAALSSRGKIRQIDLIIQYEKVMYVWLCFQPIFPDWGVAKLLLDCGSNVNAKNESKSTPLHVASIPYNFCNKVITIPLRIS